jgi:hypothetical protein
VEKSAYYNRLEFGEILDRAVRDDSQGNTFFKLEVRFSNVLYVTLQYTLVRQCILRCRKSVILDLAVRYDSQGNTFFKLEVRSLVYRTLRYSIR